MAKQEHSYESICREIEAGQYRPIYVLMGEEPYFIDRITDLLIERVPDKEGRDFNQVILYGADTEATDVLNAARRYPMMSDIQLVVVREAQLIKDIELLTNYVKKPLASTVLVINYKYKSLDRRKSLASAVEKNGILFDSKKIPDYKMPDFITAVLRERAFGIQGNVVHMLTEYIGNDPELLHRELDKLQILMTNQPVKTLTPGIIEKNIGISKDFNNFELKSAVVQKNSLKAYRIARYFEQDPKNHPIQATLPVLFDFFSNLLILHSSKEPSEKAMTTMGIRFPATKDYQIGLKNFSALKVFNLMHEIRLADARSKGVHIAQSVTDGEILKELLYKILH
ncbi:MAG: DNA polymerase III subunit delta [Tannerella sp.]|jgi:DNA polymerase-3 subunit delta|nr:DNA polymerase III subunit delta [Tannerella sp.]